MFKQGETMPEEQNRIITYTYFVNIKNRAQEKINKKKKQPEEKTPDRQSSEVGEGPRLLSRSGSMLTS